MSRSIAHNRELAGCSLAADHLFRACISFLDVEGRMTGDPELVKLTALPLRKEITTAMIPALLLELMDAEDPMGEPLLIWYQYQGKQILEFPGFARQQKGLRKNREAPSKFAPSNTPGAVRMTGTDPAQLSLIDTDPRQRLRRKSGPAPEPSGPGPGEVEVEGEGEGKVKKRPSTNVLGAAPRVDKGRTVNTPDDLTDGQLMGLVRQHLYVPDGKAPPGYDDGRDVLVIRALRARGQSGHDIAAAIEGLAMLRDRGELDWNLHPDLPMRPGGKCTMRALYNMRTGVRPVLMLAQETYHKHGARRRDNDRGGLSAIGNVLKGMTG